MDEKDDKHTRNPIEAVETKSSVNEASSKRRKKMLLIVASISAIAFILAILFVMLLRSDPIDEDLAQDSKQTESSEAATSESEQATSPQLLFATDTFAYSYDGEELARTGEARADEKIVAVTRDRKTVYLLQGEQNSISKNLVKLVDGERTVVSDVGAFAGEAFVTFGGLSPDETKLLYFHGDQNFTYTLGAIDLESGEASKGYAMELMASTLTPLISGGFWVNEQEIVGAESSCFECDGPVKPRLHRVNVVSGEITELADLQTLKNSNQSLGSFVLSHDRSSAYVVTESISRLGTSSVNVENGTSTIYEIGAKTGSVTEVVELPGQLVNVRGLSSDSSKLVGTVQSPDDYNDESDIQPGVITFIDTANGSLSEIPVSVSQLDDMSVYYGAMTYDTEQEILYFAVESSPSQEELDQRRLVVYSLPLAGEDENSVSTLFDMTGKDFQQIIELSIQ